MYFVGLLIKVGSFWLASQLELARYTTELKSKLSTFKNSNEPSRTDLLTSEFASFEFSVRPYLQGIASCFPSRFLVPRTQSVNSVRASQGSVAKKKCERLRVRAACLPAARSVTTHFWVLPLFFHFCSQERTETFREESEGYIYNFQASSPFTTWNRPNCYWLRNPCANELMIFFYIYLICHDFRNINGRIKIFDKCTSCAVAHGA
jgi:hypothetical protein